MLKAMRRWSMICLPAMSRVAWRIHANISLCQGFQAGAQTYQLYDWSYILGRLLRQLTWNTEVSSRSVAPTHVPCIQICCSTPEHQHRQTSMNSANWVADPLAFGMTAKCAPQRQWQRSQGAPGNQLQNLRSFFVCPVIRIIQYSRLIAQMKRKKPLI